MSTASAAIQDGHVPLDTDRIVGRSKLLGDLRDLIRRKHDSIRTEQAYRQWAKRFLLFHGKRHPNEMGEAESVAFLSHLAVQRNVAASTQNQALDAIMWHRRETRRQTENTNFALPSGESPVYSKPPRPVTPINNVV